MNASRHDADFTFSRSDDPRTVGPNQSDSLPFYIIYRSHHILDRHTFGNRHNERDFDCSCLNNSVCGKRRWNENHGCIRPSSLHCLFHSVENWNTFEILPTLARGHSTDNIGSIIPTTTGMQLPLGSSDSLNQDSRFAVDEDCHTFLSILI